MPESGERTRHLFVNKATRWIEDGDLAGQLHDETKVPRPPRNGLAELDLARPWAGDRRFVRARHRLDVQVAWQEVLEHDPFRAGRLEPPNHRPRLIPRPEDPAWLAGVEPVVTAGVVAERGD